VAGTSPRPSVLGATGAENRTAAFGAPANKEDEHFRAVLLTVLADPTKPRMVRFLSV
jgi:hypothetical protein